MRRILLGMAAVGIASGAPTFPGKEWTEWPPDRAGMHRGRLQRMARYLEGRGMVVRRGHQVFVWGDPAKRSDIASAAKPIYSWLLLRAVETGRLDHPDVLMAVYEPRLRTLNSALGHKDARMTFRHAATQTSGYGVQEAPGTVFNYNDWQMALFWDTLFGAVWNVPARDVDRVVWGPEMTSVIECQDKPTMLAFGARDRPGRIAISPRDFCRIGWLVRHGGKWRNRRLLSAAHARQLTSEPLPLGLPVSAGTAAEMIPGQRTIGSGKVPDNQTPHFGCYSWLWWVNSPRANGRRLWPDAPPDTICALGHQNGMRGLAVIPSWDVVMSWNETALHQKPWPHPAEDPHPLNEALRLLRPAK